MDYNKTQCAECKNKLTYNSFTVIQIQTFCSDNLLAEKNDGFLQCISDPLDRQIFTYDLPFYKRYQLKGFNIKIEELAKDGSAKTILEGYVSVRASKFFNSCVQLSYRMVVEFNNNNTDELCKINNVFCTDSLILVAGVAQKVEHWHTNDANEQSIDGREIQRVTVTNCHLDSGSNFSPNFSETIHSFDEVMRRYQHYFDANSKLDVPYLHTFIDIQDKLKHSGDIDFDNMGEDEIISHIEQYHRAELMGIMSLYPKEWKYRSVENFRDICGYDISIDTDDLVLTNQNVSIVIGTYGKRNSEESTDWAKYINENIYDVSWPEYLTLIELILAKKQTINYTISKYIQNSKSYSKHYIWKKIKNNAAVSLKFSEIILELDSIRYLRYVSHKHMFNKAAKNLDLPKDEEYLEEVITRIDNSLNNANNYVHMKSGNESGYFLLSISAASLFGILFQKDIIPFIANKHSEESGYLVATILITVTVLLITAVGVSLFTKFFNIFRYMYKEKIKKDDKRIF